MSALCACVASASLDFFVAPNRLIFTGCTAASAPLDLRKKKNSMMLCYTCSYHIRIHVMLCQTRMSFGGAQDSV